MHEFDHMALLWIQNRDARFHITCPLGRTQAERLGRLIAANLSGLTYLFLFIEVADVEIATAQQGFEIGKLKNPRPHRGTRGIEALLLQENGKEHFLDNVLGLRSVTKNSERHRIHLAAIAMEQL